MLGRPDSWLYAYEFKLYGKRERERRERRNRERLPTSVSQVAGVVVVAPVVGEGVPRPHGHTHRAPGGVVRQPTVEKVLLLS